MTNKKEVAVETLKFDTGDPALLSRFRHERQTLSHLEHPNIARLLDGGTTPEGTPYIFLEYVAGVPINKYCEEQNLPGLLQVFTRREEEKDRQVAAR
jgi:serine/threonine protein kinase